MHAGERWRLGHRPGLDGLRGVAVLLVVVDHLGVPRCFGLAQLGVTAFFILSGFLITSLLLEERAATGSISFRRFYMRRARRLAPALVVCAGVVAVVAAGVGMGNVGVVPAITYTMDFVQAGGGQYQEGPFGHTWTLAIEEQFYLVWPVLLVGMAAAFGRGVWVAIAAGYAGLVAWSVLLVQHGASSARLYYGADVRGSALLIGCAVAAYLHHHGTARPRRRAVPILEWRPLRDTGRYSYGVYLWHFPVLCLLRWFDPQMPWWRLAAVSLPVTAGVVALSWRYVEQPFRRSGDLVRREAVLAQVGGH